MKRSTYDNDDYQDYLAYKRMKEQGEFDNYSTGKKHGRRHGWLIILLVLIICYFVSGGAGNKKNTTTANNATTKTNTSVSSSQNTVKYLKKADVASEMAYMFAVEVPGYKYDNYYAGDYKVYMDCALTKSAKETKDGKAVVPQIFEIYVADQDFKNKYDLVASGIQPVLSIGGQGYNNEAYKLSLKPNQYVYIYPVKSNIVNWSGIVHLVLIE